MAEYVMRLHGLAGVVDTRADKVLWIQSYDVEANGGRGEFVFTRFVDRAMRFDSHEAATQALFTQSETHPFRDDGEPNRPFKMLHIEIMTAEEAAHGS